MTQKEFDEILHRYLHNECSAKEAAFVEEWFESLQHDEVFISNAQEFQAKGKIWALLRKRLALHAESRNSFWKYTGIAAAAIILVASGFFVFFEYSGKSSFNEDYIATVPTGVRIVNFNNTGKEIVKLALVDGSSVLVHPGSQLKYPEKFGDTREVYLSGEAFFQIAKDPKHPFLVHTNEVTTRVLGTSFRVKAYQEHKDIIVAVSTGKVSVFSKPMGFLSTRKEVILIPNEQVIYSRKEGSTEKKLVENPRILTPNPSMNLAYVNEPVTKLFKTLEKMYGVTIQCNEKVLSNCSITTEMTDEGLFERMDVICHVLSATYSVQGTTIIVNANGCSN